MYWVRLECPQDRTNRSRPSQWESDGSCRMTFWKSRYAAGARLMAVPGGPLPTFWTASAARTRAVSTARTSRSVHLALRATGSCRLAERPAIGLDDLVRGVGDIGGLPGPATLSGLRHTQHGPRLLNEVRR